jgi:hypothetical protein
MGKTGCYFQDSTDERENSADITGDVFLDGRSVLGYNVCYDICYNDCYHDCYHVFYICYDVCYNVYCKLLTVNFPSSTTSL